jgi:ribonuclease-3
MSKPNLGAFMLNIGYTFSDLSLLETALTHASIDAGKTRPVYQRLEFVGDRVLGLVVSDILYQRFPDADEGELALRFNGLVRRETLADIARELDVGPYLVLGASEVKSGGRDKDAILADALEAVLAAIYLDAGYDTSRQVVITHWEKSLEKQRLAPRDPKTILQEWSQGQGLGLPIYSELERSGPDHSPIFVIEVQVGNRNPAKGEGASKQAAERIAAQAMIDCEIEFNHV